MLSLAVVCWIIAVVGLVSSAVAIIARQERERENAARAWWREEGLMLCALEIASPGAQSDASPGSESRSLSASLA